MGFWTALVIIAGMMIVGAVIKSHYNARLGYATDENGKPIGNPQVEAELRRELDELRERIQVLERIATDDPQAGRLAAEIEQLRQIEEEKEERQ